MSEERKTIYLCLAQKHVLALTANLESGLTERYDSHRLYSILISLKFMALT